MDVNKILEDLRREREQIEEAILTLERLAEGRGRRRGRPPTWLAEARKRGEMPPAANAARVAALHARMSPGGPEKVEKAGG
jgi:hypothetical protein